MALGFSAPIRADYNCLNFSVVDHIWGEARRGFQTVKKTQEKFSQGAFKCLVKVPPDNPVGLPLGKNTEFIKHRPPPPPPPRSTCR